MKCGHHGSEHGWQTHNTPDICMHSIITSVHLLQLSNSNYVDTTSEIPTFKTQKPILFLINLSNFTLDIPFKSFTWNKHIVHLKPLFSSDKKLLNKQ